MPLRAELSSVVVCVKFFEDSCSKLTAIPADDHMLVRELDVVQLALLDNIAARQSFPS